ncbi:MAG: type II toxin-antitoxin system Phd/YefM family antitoxin [Bacilli bacterium]|jgi:antitoxin Phd|nr:type II toxin-antitoxin system Phd/YefM family antitoxin [Bacilli bacterium]
MKLRIKQLVSLKEANQNFSRVARKVDEEGYVLLLRNNKPAYLVFAYDEDDVVDDNASLFDALHRLIERRKNAKLRRRAKGGEKNG